MEMDDQATTVAENPEQTISSSELEQQQQQGTTSPARSYECTFCKRGFSNAQALGGHTNIHRRDKAKLKQPSSTSSSDHNSTTIVSKSNIPAAAASSYSPALVMADAPRKWPWPVINQDDHGIGIDKRDQTHAGEIRKLALFDEKPAQTQRHQNFPISKDHHDQVLQGCSSGSSDDDDDDDQLDLELRLGPDRSQDSSPTITTKKFF